MLIVRMHTVLHKSLLCFGGWVDYGYKLQNARNKGVELR